MSKCIVGLFDVCLMVFNATFNNISVISWWSVLLVEETGGPGKNHRPVTSHWQTLSQNAVHLALVEIRTHNISVLLDDLSSSFTSISFLTNLYFSSKQQNKKENKNNPFEDPTSNIPSKEKVLKVYFTLLLFIVVVGCGIVARVTLHILIWHINPPNTSDNSVLNTFGGLLKNNCTVCSEGATDVTGCATNKQERTIIDDTWIWAVFLVIIAPYVLTFMSTFCRICFKSNAELNYWVLLVVSVFLKVKYNDF